jgi:hypothetical protein
MDGCGLEKNELATNHTISERDSELQNTPYVPELSMTKAEKLNAHGAWLNVGVRIGCGGLLRPERTLCFQ